MTNDDLLLTLCTCPDRESAQRLATTLVEARLAACVNILPGALSVFSWEGRTEQVDEVLLMIKTGSAQFDELQRRVTQLHPYEVPEIIAIPIADGLPAYLDWLRACTRSKP
ncbi:divalent-cation tolerance protein CutA [Thioalkalicoccus limnaeus]|uniref:Divalent-cation tolerance protein CutA n=1 Tax=Thioalkalicoccus limnaeus TaxID=120681 RepID=A0ABV4BDX9_9GAMM